MQPLGRRIGEHHQVVERPLRPVQIRLEVHDVRGAHPATPQLLPDPIRRPGDDELEPLRLREAQGKVLFALVDLGPTRDTYVGDAAALEGGVSLGAPATGTASTRRTPTTG